MQCIEPRMRQLQVILVPLSSICYLEACYIITFCVEDMISHLHQTRDIKAHLIEATLFCLSIKDVKANIPIWHNDPMLVNRL